MQPENLVPMLNAAVKAASPPFKAQVTNGLFIQDVFYAVAAVCLLLVVASIGLIDAGLVQRKNLLDTWLQKIVCSMIGALGMYMVGYAIWQIQYYEAFGVAHPIRQALTDWWGFGHNTVTFSQNINPSVTPSADVYQIFLAFFMAYGAAAGALLHSAGIERVRAVPLYILTAFATAIVCPLVLFFTWGSTSPLTNRGVHDYNGVYSLYVVIGTWALILAWRAGPRLGAFRKDSRTSGPVPHNLGLTALGIGLLMFAAPFAFLGCGYWVPGSGYYGISLNNSGFGVALINVFVAFAGGVIGGALISYRTKNSIMILLGVPAGYVSAGTSLDTGKPWQIFIVSFLGAFVVYGVYLLLGRLGIDEKKVVPLGLGAGSFGAIAGGVIGSGHKTGGYFGLTGKYAPQHATISVGWQLAGLGVTLAIAATSGLILVFLLEKTVGLRVTERTELRGLDEGYWQVPPPPSAELDGAAGAEQNGLPVRSTSPVSAAP